MKRLIKVEHAEIVKHGARVADDEILPKVERLADSYGVDKFWFWKGLLASLVGTCAADIGPAKAAHILSDVTTLVNEFLPEKKLQ